VNHLVYVEPGRVEWQSTDDPEITDASSALVRPLAVARCDLDMPMANLGLFPGPFAVGHETVAEVVAVGSAVERVQPGDHVLVPFQVSCGACATCASGRYAACITCHAPAGAAFGFGTAGGGHGGTVADVLAVPHADHLLVGAPLGVSSTALATLPDNVLDGYRATAGPLAAQPGAEVLIVGGGLNSVALYAVASAVALGADAVRYIDHDHERLEAAAKLGAEPIERTGNWPRRFPRAPITVDASMEADGLAATVRSTEPYGWCTSLSIYFQPSIELPMLEMYTRGITLHTSRVDARRLLPSVAELVAAGGLDPLAVPTTVVPWADAAAAWLEPAIKLVVTR
jgi:threonine dehydrogenase-like Zn-dependent dehydrogenase